MWALYIFYLTNDIQIVEKNYNTYAGNQDKWTKKTLELLTLVAAIPFFLKDSFWFHLLLYMWFCSNWGTENDPEQSYHNGNSDPRGFGKFDDHHKW